VPPGYALLETIGRKTGKARRTPVGNARIGNQFWIVAEHGMKAIARFRIVSQLLAQTQLAKDVRVVSRRKHFEPAGGQRGHQGSPFN
jgi:hypothetical protein